MEKLMEPKNIKIYDNGGKSFDRYTVVFTGQNYHLGLSSDPYSPLGTYFKDQTPTPIDEPTYSHLGKKITWRKLPPQCQKAVIETHRDIWGE